MSEEKQRKIEVKVNTGYAGAVHHYGFTVPIFQENDGDGPLLVVSVHYGGFMISINGDNHSKTDVAYVDTFIDFRMLEDIKKAMDEHKHLIDEDLYT